MAKKNKRITDEANEPRASITVRNAVLWSGFLVLFVISIFTVMIPELSDDGAEDEADAQGQADDDGDDASDDATGEPSAAPSTSP
jgi:hypothetical protein